MEVKTIAARAAALATYATVAIATQVCAADWSGSETVIDGTLHVINPSQPIESPVTKEPVELWRAGGDDDDDILFGVISAISLDNDGNVYLLDAQLSVVHVFNPDGEFLREIGREGEGPGEFRRAGDMFLTGDGNVAVVQRMPGKIIQLTREGDPLDNYPIPEGTDGAPLFLTSVIPAGNDLIVATREFIRGDNSFKVREALLRVNNKGDILATFDDRMKERNMANFVFNEVEDAQPIFAASGDGRVFLNTDFHAYQINVFDKTGKLERVIDREYQHRVRSDKEKEDNVPEMVIRHGNKTVKADAVVSDTDRDIGAMYTRHDGSLWVVTSRGGMDAPRGTFATFDVFDRDGRFTQQVTIQCEGSFRLDGIHFVDGQLFIVKGLASATDAMFAMGDGDEEEMEDEEIEPLQVVCYDLDEILKASR